MKKEIVLAIWMLAMVFGGAARADDVNELKTQLAEQQKVLLQMQQRLEQLETNQKAQEQNVDEKITKAVASREVNVPESIKWVENMKISGDLRYRYDGVHSQSKGKWASIERNRLRARIGIYDKINDEVDIGFRLGSGSNADPTSTNQTEGNAFSKKPIWLDLAYFDWHPKRITGFDFIGGKMVNPFYRVGNNELIWDVDLNPEGLAAKYELPISDSLKAYINGGGFWVGNPDNPDNTVGASTSLFGIQSYLKNTFEDKSYLLGGLSFFGFGKVKGAPNVSSLWGKNSFFGNTSVAGTYKYGYDIAEVFAEYGTKIAGYPVAVFGDVACNTDAPSSKNNAWLIGTTFNKAKDPGSWQIGYDYRYIESDAVLGQFNYSDFNGGGTNAKGHQFNFIYQLAKNFQIGLTYLMDQNITTNDKYRRLMADLVFKF